ncbi:hypothetical protein CLU97_1145 [Chryseobacterium sp. 7]|uniref:helix-turn-helix domain-containing protein n=1 Tax=Chryseobacterium sp. 7 TaxID=2035214 RepID=UPI000EB1AE36|nr:helix-turn-helix domain-containing protein [Chryseobacterium sp. 7]RLJ31708.1 hypothetical protein CLU97_1145 [Chryseobacterium sp. 7]
MKNTPNYSKIYKDLILTKYPEKWNACEKFLTKDPLSVLDVIKINNILFSNKSNKEVLDFNQRHKSYTRTTVFEILDFQKKNKLNNTQLAEHFKMSRNTITKWRKIFFAEEC